MARIRSVHPGLFTDEAFVSLSDAAQVLFIGLWTEADDQGVFEWKPITIRMRLRPAKDGPIEPLLAELEASECIRRYELDGRQYGAVRNFCRFQHPKKPNQIYPITPEFRTFTASDHASTEPDGVEDEPVPKNAELSPQMEGRGEKRKASLRSDKSRGSRLAEDWRPSPDEADYAANLGMSPSLIAGEIENFRDFWRAKAGAGGIKLDWPATWRTWVRKTCERRGIKPPAANGHGANGAAERTYDPRNAHDAQLMLNIGRERGLWDSGRFGPKPGELGCLIPENLIKPGDGDGWDEWAAGIAKGK